ncbi:peroxisomal targeting signal 1 receptor isoform X1 [Hydra vulgaris]|nr:peroxisomal targeting signal 1 receptor [Hydra vulgaris]
MAMAKLVAAECGRMNPLMELTNRFHEGNLHQAEFSTSHQETYSFVPQTFNMQLLLNEMHGIEKLSNMASVKENQRTDCEKISNEWKTEYFEKSSVLENFKNDFKSQTHGFQSSFYRPSYHPLYRPLHGIYHKPNMNVQQIQWRPECLNETSNILEEKFSEENRTACEILTKIEDEISAEEDQANKWVHEYATNYNENPATIVEDLTQSSDGSEEYWVKLQENWNELFSQEQFQNEEELFLNTYTEKDYRFESKNPFAGIKNSFEEGLTKLNEGDLISAILLFEEAVQVNPSHVDAWKYLGTSQAENEQEMLAICALKKCLDLNPENLEARMALAVSYTNECMQTQACNTLKAWIHYNPRYSHLVSETRNDLNVTSIVSSSVVKEIENLFLAAARISPEGNIDADIQIGLGVLYNIVGDYVKAIDCFNTGILARPDSANLWNKLGATLANSGRSDEAIEAYRNALELRPGFIRCRYNLGISCVNLKAYPQAIEHFLVALNMQKKNEDPTRTASTMSENIWSTLRMTSSLLGRKDLLSAVDRRDLNFFNDAFKINEVS